MELPLTKSANLRKEEVIGIAPYSRSHVRDLQLHLESAQPSCLFPTNSGTRIRTTASPRHCGHSVSHSKTRRLYASEPWREVVPRQRRFAVAPWPLCRPKRLECARNDCAFLPELLRLDGKGVGYAKPNGPLPMVLVIQPSVDPLNSNT